MIDNIIRIEDFKQQMEKQNLDVDKLRICVMRENLQHYFFQARIILTIPNTDKTILQHEISRKMFNSVFMDNQDSKEYQDFKTWCNDGYATANKHFSAKIIEGNWIDK